MMIQRVFWGGVGLLVVLLSPRMTSAQTSDERVLATVPTGTVESLFGEPTEPSPPPPSVGERVEITVPTPRVDSLFRSPIEIEVFTTGVGLEPEEYRLVVTDVDELSVWEERRVPANGSVRLVLEPGRYALSLDDLPPRCGVVSMESGPLVAGVPDQIAFDVQCDPPTSLTVAVSESPAGPSGSATVQLAGFPERQIEAGTVASFPDLEPGPNQLRLALPDPVQVIGDLDVTFPQDTPDSVVITLDGGTGQRAGPNDTIRFSPEGPGDINLTLLVPRLSVEPPSRTSLAVEVQGDGADALEPGMATIRIGEGERQEVGPEVVARFEGIDGDSLRLVLELDDFDPRADGWHLSAGLGAIAVAATDPKSFITPTVGLSLVKGPERAENLYLNAQVGYWRSGPSSADPVLPEDPRPPFQNRTIWTWALGASYFGTGWGGLGVSASWVEGRETASEEDKYINRSRGVAVGPRFRLLTDDPWPSVIFGLDAQYGEADELRSVEPDWRWSLTPVLSLSYVFR